MDYKELEKGIKYFEDKWPPDRDCKYKYSELRLRDIQKPGYWLHLKRMDEMQLAEEIIQGFLNKWNCRIPMSKRTLDKSWKVLTGLKKAVEQLPDYYAALDGYRIEDIDFNDHTALKGREESIRNVIDSIYSIFLQIEGFGPTAASKLMHMALFNLFVMCDRGILQRYCIPKEKLPGLEKKQKSYIAFLILMQENIRHVIESYQQASDIMGPEAIKKIQAEHNDFPLPRLLDMANMAARDCEQAICIACMKKAKARWVELGLVTTDDSGDKDSSD